MIVAMIVTAFIGCSCDYCRSVIVWCMLCGLCVCEGGCDNGGGGCGGGGGGGVGGGGCGCGISGGGGGQEENHSNH